MADRPESSSVEDALEALIAWYAAMGVDAVLEDDPVDRFAESAAERERRAKARPAPGAPPGGSGGQGFREELPRFGRAEGGRAEGGRAGASGRPVPPPQPLSAPAAATVPGGDAVMAARAAAASAGTLDALRTLLEGFDGCNLKVTAKSLVFGDGNPAARLMFVGEAPGREEDVAGKPFVGRSGQLLDRILAALGMSRAADAYIANAVYWRPPGNREPSDQEIAICRPFILRQIELVDPDVLVFLGGQPAKALMGGEAARTGIRRLRGRWLEFPVGARTIKAMPTFHPAYLLRNPAEKKWVWKDMLAVRAALKGGGGREGG